MIRMKFYSGTWSGIPASGSCYTLPRNPSSINVEDNTGSLSNGGLNTYSYGTLFYDNRQRELIWDGIPATSEFTLMVKTLQSYLVKDYIYADFGNNLVPNLYSSGADWKKINIINVEINNANGSVSYIESGQQYNVYGKITVTYELLGDM
jgi:hypothetical protein